MVVIGKNVKYDDYGRVTLPAALAELLNLEKGVDEVCWMIVDGSVMLSKVTKSYRGFDFESKEIEDKLRAYESKYTDDYDPEDDDPELQEQKAWEEYQRDKAQREALKSKKNN